VESPDLCPACGHEMQIGDFPFCPHGSGVQSVISDEWVGGRVFENGFDKPTRFFSPSEHRAALAARGLEIRAKWAGVHDKVMSRWDAPDATTLANAAILLTRGRKTADPADEPIPITVTKVAR